MLMRMMFERDPDAIMQRVNPSDLESLDDTVAGGVFDQRTERAVQWFVDAAHAWIRENGAWSSV
jgi:hypothetical protein